MRNISQVLFLMAIAITSYGQRTFNMELIAEVDNGETGNDIWGYVDTSGVEYAIMGTRTTTKIWSLEDPTNPTERISIPGPAGTWRDIKSFEDHIYVTSDQGDQGLLIIDMSAVDDTITYKYWADSVTLESTVEPLERCHNLYIDTDTGFMYLADCNRNGDVLIFDLNQDKKNPTQVSTVPLSRTHDAYVQNDKLYVSELEFGFKIYDVSDPANPVYLSGETSSFNFTHNAWVSEDEKYVFTTDERQNAFVESFDVSDLDDIKALDRFQSVETQNQGVIPHNTHFLDGFLITSWYSDGVVITDVTKPDNMVKVGAFDSESQTTAGFVGSWGVYPYLPSGLIIATDGPGLSEKLKVFKPKKNNGEDGYQRAAYLEGTVTNASTGNPIPNVKVVILGDVMNEKSTTVMGEYKTGMAQDGIYQVEFSHPEYNKQIVEVELISGEVTILDVTLSQVMISGVVTDSETEEIIDGASVVLLDLESGNNISTITDENGAYSFRVGEGKSYSIQVAKWGYLGAEQTIISEDNVDYPIVLSAGYQDDFFADLGWTVSGEATAGEWEIAVPNRLGNNNGLTQTDLDIEGDIGNSYYVTGASGSSIGENDIDGGSMILTSPVMNFSAPVDRIDLSYHLWFSNVGGDGNPNDELKVEITNGTSSFELPTKTESSSEWSDLIEVTVTADNIEFNDQMQIIVSTGDDEPGHVVEAGIDVFNAIGYMSTNTTDLTYENIGVTVFPNPTTDYIYVNSNKLLEGENLMVVTNATGQITMTKYVASTTERFNIESLPSGIYNVQIVGSNKKSETVRIVKH